MDAPNSIDTPQPFRLQVIRFQRSARSCIGKLSINGVYFSLTLENVLKLIPEGTYVCKIRYSPHNGRDVIGLENVPGRNNIEIHPANQPEQLEGCIAVGETQAPDWLGNSAMIFARLMSKFSEPATITIESAPLDTQEATGWQHG